MPQWSRTTLISTVWTRSATELLLVGLLTYCYPGDEVSTSRLDERIRAFDVQTWIHQHQKNLGQPIRTKGAVLDGSHLHNPYSGVPYAWQLTETVDDFLHRLPPATTDQTEDTPWIFICNPYIPRVHKHQGEGQSSLGNEDEAPEEEGSQILLVEQGGRERLELACSFIEGLKKTNKRESTIERDVRKERKQAVDDILTLAHAARVRAGKVSQKHATSRSSS